MTLVPEPEIQARSQPLLQFAPGVLASATAAREAWLSHGPLSPSRAFVQGSLDGPFGPFFLQDKLRKFTAHHCHSFSRQARSRKALGARRKGLGRGRHRETPGRHGLEGSCAVRGHRDQQGRGPNPLALFPAKYPWQRVWAPRERPPNNKTRLAAAPYQALPAKRPYVYIFSLNSPSNPAPQK